MPMVYFKENYNFPRFQRGSNIFSRGGGGVLFLGGGGGPIAYSLLNPIYNLCFSRGSVVSALASGARGPRFDPRSRRGKFRV